MIKSKREAVATHVQFDFQEIEEYRYHYGKTSQPVYALTDAYYCATKPNQRPAKHVDGMDWKWKEVKNEFINKDGWIIWKADCESE